VVIREFSILTRGSVDDVRLSFEAFATLVWARLALRFAPRRVLRAAVVERGETRDPNPRLIEIFARVAARAPFHHTCIHRSLALQRILARRGVHARLCIGVGEKPRVLPGHAWLEVRGQIINDQPDMVRRYRPLVGFFRPSGQLFDSIHRSEVPDEKSKPAVR